MKWTKEQIDIQGDAAECRGLGGLIRWAEPRSVIAPGSSRCGLEPGNAADMGTVGTTTSAPGDW